MGMNAKRTKKREISLVERVHVYGAWAGLTRPHLRGGLGGSSEEITARVVLAVRRVGWGEEQVARLEHDLLALTSRREFLARVGEVCEVVP